MKEQKFLIFEPLVTTGLKFPNMPPLDGGGSTLRWMRKGDKKAGRGERFARKTRSKSPGFSPPRRDWRPDDASIYYKVGVLCNAGLDCDWFVWWVRKLSLLKVAAMIYEMNVLKIAANCRQMSAMVVFTEVFEVKIAFQRVFLMTTREAPLCINVTFNL